MTKVLFVCLGNICRSPMAEAIFNRQLEERGLSEKITADSAGTSNYHIGGNPDPRTIECSLQNKTAISHKARQISASDYEDFDFIMAMDRSNLSNIQSVFKKDHPQLHLMRIFDDQQNSLDVPDPYFGDMEGFQEVYDILWRSTEKLIDHIVREKGL